MDTSTKERATKLLRKYTTSFADVPLASGQDVLRLQVESCTGGPAVVLIDVRDTAEQLVSMLPGAITAADFEAQCKSDADCFSNTVCVPYCTIGYRSGLYCRRLQNGDFHVKPAAVMNGEGVVLWSHDVGLFAGGVKRLHCYGREWEAAADGFSTVVYSLQEQVSVTPTFLQSWLKYLRALLIARLRRWLG